jgi:predicted ATPase
VVTLTGPGGCGKTRLAPSRVHLSHIFAKLGITTRAELAAQAAARDLTAR